MEKAGKADNAAGSGSTPASPPTLEPVDSPQLHPLQCFALADLLGLAPTTLHQMVVAAATEAASLPTAASTGSITTTASTGEDMCNGAKASTSPVEEVMLLAVLEQMSARFHAATSSPTYRETPLQAAAAANLPSVLEAPPWSVDATLTTTTAAPSLSSEPASLLPAVLCTSRGLARVEALHGSFVLRLLAALLHAGGGLEEGQVASPAMQHEQQQQQQERQGNVIHFTVPRAEYQRAFLQLLQLYAPFMRIHLGSVCAAVDRLFSLALCEPTSPETDTAQTDGGTLVECLQRDFIHGPAQEWLSTFLTFTSDTVDFFSQHSRRVARSELCCVDADTAASTRTTTPVKPPNGGVSTTASKECGQGSPSSAQAASQAEATEAVWTLKTLGIVLAVVNSPGCAEVEGELAAADPDQNLFTSADAENREVLPVVVTRRVSSSPSSSPPSCHPRNSAEGIALAVAISHMSHHLLCSTPNEAPPLHSSNNNDNDAPQPSKTNAVITVLRELRAISASENYHHDTNHYHREEENDGDAAADSSNASADVLQLLCRACTRLLTQQRETQQKQQHRLLAAAERAVQRVLRLPAMPWNASAMAVALCDVTIYQLRTQLQQRQQRWRQLESERADLSRTEEVEVKVEEEEEMEETSASTSAEARAAIMNVTENALSPPPQLGRVSCSPKSTPTTSLGEALWSEADFTEDEKKAAEGKTAAPHRSEFVKVAASQLPPSELAGASPAVTATQLKKKENPLHHEPHITSAPRLCLYTPRGSSLSRSTQLTNRHDVADGDDEKEHHSNSEGSAHDLGPLARLSDPVRYFSATRSMEHLWELPARVPRTWTSVLATLMACCTLCLTPTTKVASRLCLLTGQPLVNGEGSPDKLPVLPALTVAQSSMQSSAHASPRPSLLDFGFTRRHDPVAAATADPFPPSGSSPSGRTSLASERDGTARASAAVWGGAPTSDGAVIGALAQWHLRGLIQQLRLPTDGIELLALDVGAGSFLPSARSLPFTSVPSFAGAVGGASWFAAYTQANRAASATARPQAHRDSLSVSPKSRERATTSATSGSSGSSSTVMVVRQLSPVFLLASCAALQHLLQTQVYCFAYAQLSGTAMRELRSGVMAARRTAGGMVGWLAGMLQCTSSPLTASSPAHAVGGGDGKSCSRSVGGPDTVTVPPGLRARSLWWGDVSRIGPGGDRSATAVLDALLFDGEMEVNDDAALPTAADSPSSLRASQSSDAAAVAAAAREGEDNEPSVSAGTCALTEAVLVAASFLGSRVVAVALPQLQAPERAKDTVGALSTAQKQWCDALQALAGLVMDAHRAHRSRHSTRPSPQPPYASANSAAAATSPVKGIGQGLDASRAASVGSTRESSLTKPPAVVHTPAPLPPLLSAEAQFGLGTFFLALVRALLELYGGDTTGPAHTDGAAPPQRLPTIAELMVAQCVFALATVLDDLLHDYTRCPPAALCDVLAMMTVIQPPHASTPVKGGDEDTASRSSSPTVWEALKETPYWDTARLGALVSVSQIWNSRSPEPAAAPPPRDGLLGYIPCSRDPATLSWLPASLWLWRASREVHSRGSARTLLEWMAEEEALILGKQTHMCEEQPRLPNDGVSSAVGDENKEDEASQLAVALASSQRYVWWMTRLQHAWRQHMLMESAFYL